MFYALFPADDVFHNKKILISWKSPVENISEVSEEKLCGLRPAHSNSKPGMSSEAARRKYDSDKRTPARRRGNRAQQHSAISA